MSIAVKKDFYDKELRSLNETKSNKLFYIVLIISLLVFSYIGYLILTKEPPVSERNFFDSIGIETDKIQQKY